MFEFQHAAIQRLQEIAGENWQRYLPHEPGMSQACKVRLDRLGVRCSAYSPENFHNHPQFKCTDGHSLRSRSAHGFQAYGRARWFVGVSSGFKFCLQYERRAPWIAPSRVTLYADDKTGLTPTQVFSVLELLSKPQLALVELAFDFGEQSRVNREFVLRHGVFGKSRRRTVRKYHIDYWGARKSPKMVRSYWKSNIKSQRVEIEFRGTWLENNGIGSPYDFPRFRSLLLSRQIGFFRVNWPRVARHLRCRHFQWKSLLQQATSRSLCLTDVMHYLRNDADLPNAHRFLVPIATSCLVRSALGAWSRKWLPRDTRGVSNGIRTAIAENQ